MNRHPAQIALSRLALSVAVLAATLPPARANGRSAGGTPPNIVVILADDVGWSDVSFHDPLVITPALDRLAAEGVRLERYYTTPVCSPARQALMTGRYPIRWGLQRHALRPWEDGGMPRTEEILPEMLRAGGYGAALVTGKWHMGAAYSKFLPIRQGFTEFLGSTNAAEDYYTHERFGVLDWWLDFEPRYEDFGIYHTNLVSDRAVQFIADHAADSEPFVLYVPFLAAHLPNQAPWWQISKYLLDGLDMERATHLAQVTVMDRQIGRILDELDAQGITDETLVWFLSDNGGHLPSGASNAPLSDGKGSVYEGGLRVPSVVRYPQGALPQGTLNKSMVRHIDVLPTIRGMIEAAGGSLAAPLNPLDGLDLFAVLRGDTPGPNREHFNLYDFNQADGLEALAVTTFAAGQMSWKLVWNGADFALPPPPNAQIELYNVRLDPGEHIDVAAQQPFRVLKLLLQLAVWRSQDPGEDGFKGPDDIPPGWEARPESDTIDQPTPCNVPYMLARANPANLKQELLGLGAGGLPVQVGTTSNGPDGFPGLILGALGRNPSDGLLYGLDPLGQRVYQVDVAGLVIDLGEVRGISGPVAIRGW